MACVRVLSGTAILAVGYKLCSQIAFRSLVSDGHVTAFSIRHEPSILLSYHHSRTLVVCLFMDARAANNSQPS